MTTQPQRAADDPSNVWGLNDHELLAAHEALLAARVFVQRWMLGVGQQLEDDWPANDFGGDAARWSPDA